MRQRNATVEEGADPGLYEVRRQLRFVDYSDAPREEDNPKEAGYTFEPGDLLRVVLRNGCGMGIDVVSERTGVVDMVWPEEVQPAENLCDIRIAVWQLRRENRRARPGRLPAHTQWSAYAVRT